jgi:S1-C subfamily serine protease
MEAREPDSTIQSESLPAGAYAAGPPGIASPALRIARPAPRPRSLATLLFGLTSFLVVFLVGAFATPWLMARWRAIEIRSEADAAYAKRRAELRAESEAADERLLQLDKRVNLISLGFREVVRKVGPAIVNLTSLASQRDQGARDSKEWQEVPDPENPGKSLYLCGSGSGFFVEPNWLLTNYHVVSHAHRLRVTFYSGYSITVGADRIKTDPLTDLAAVSLPASPPGVLREDDTVKIPFANSDEVERGDLVLALGNPLGLKHTVTHGVISAKGRLLTSFDASELLQTDTPMNKGNSGGPLFDHLGRLVGINCAIVSDSGFHQGIGFAIPSNTARDVFRQLKDKGEVERGYLGAALRDVEAAQAKAMSLERAGAVLVEMVESGQPAALAGLRKGDIIIKYNGESLSSNNPRRHLWQLIMDTKVGAEVPLTVARGGQWKAMPVTIGKRPPDKKR